MTDQQRQTALKTMGFALETKCIDPGSTDRQSEWKFVLSCDGITHEATYTAGSGIREIPCTTTDSKGRKMRVWKEIPQAPSPEQARSSRPIRPTLTDIVYCVWSDAQCYDQTRDIDEFQNEYCVDLSVSAILRMWKGCKDAYMFFDQADIDQDALIEIFEEY